MRRTPVPFLAPVLLFLTSLTLSAPLSAQSPPGSWKLEDGRAQATVREATGRGYAALPASALVSVGAEVGYGRDEVIARFGQAEVRFRVGSAEVRVAGEAKTLSNPVYSEGGVVYVPADFFRRFLEGASGGALVVEPAARLVRRVTPREPVRDDPVRSAVAAAMRGRTRVTDDVPSRVPAPPLPPPPADEPPIGADRPAAASSDRASTPANRPSADRPAASRPSTVAQASSTDRPPSTDRPSSVDRSPSTGRRSAAGAPAASGPSAPPAVPASSRRARNLVVVDAGHGGRDPGARGPGGTREKDVTLRIARRVAELLRDDPAFEVRMTRDRDTLIALHDRARLANRWRDEGQPAVFMSIHANANESRSEKGFETYFLSEARTADAKRVEEFENSAMQYEERPHGDALGFIMADLRQNHYLRESADWARIIQDELRDIHPGPNRGVKQAGFAVLRGTFMPSVLVEIGFISNHQEERLLTDPDAQERIARKLVESVKQYFSRPTVAPASD